MLLRKAFFANRVYVYWVTCNRDVAVHVVSDFSARLGPYGKSAGSCVELCGGDENSLEVFQ
eukprot:67858-Prorocentrum_lima.AAC.1